MPDPKLLLDGDYEYLSEGYYASQTARFAGEDVYPTCSDALDAYVVPVALIRVEQAGMPVPEWYLTNEYFTPPAILYGVNPFARSHAVVLDADQCAEAAQSISRNGKFVMCCQELPEDAELIEFEQVLGWTPDERYLSWAESLYQLFHLPLCRVRLMRHENNLIFSAIERLPANRLSEQAKNYLDQYVNLHG